MHAPGLTHARVRHQRAVDVRMEMLPTGSDVDLLLHHRSDRRDRRPLAEDAGGLKALSALDEGFDP